MGCFLLYSTILLIIEGVVTRGLEPPMQPGKIVPVSKYLQYVYFCQLIYLELDLIDYCTRFGLKIGNTFLFHQVKRQSYLVKILLTQPCDINSCREMSQGRSPQMDKNKICCRIWTGSGFPFRYIPPSWLTDLSATRCLSSVLAFSILCWYSKSVKDTSVENCWNWKWGSKSDPMMLIILRLPHFFYRQTH